LGSFDYLSASGAPETKLISFCVAAASGCLPWNAAVCKSLDLGYQTIVNPSFAKVANAVKNEFGFDFFRSHVSSLNLH
jgi:hypothetical protein